MFQGVIIDFPWPTGEKKMNPNRLNAHTSGPNVNMSSSTYPQNFLGTLLETSNYLDAAAKNPEISKEEVCKSMESRISILLGKMVAAPTGSSFTVFNRVEDSI